MRLTKKDEIGYFSKERACVVPLNNEIPDKFYSEDITKLGQLEDIEEELGIDLITLFKALKNGIYYTNYGHGTINYCDKPKLIPCYVYIKSPNAQEKREVHGYDFIVSKKGLTISIKTYKKYWALTKEELE